MKIKALSFFLSFLLSLHCFAQEPVPANQTANQTVDQSELIDRTILELKAKKVVDSIAAELTAQGVQFPSEEGALAEKLEAISEKMFANNPDALSRSRKINWKDIAHWTVEQAESALIEIRKMGRLDGIDVGAIYLLGGLCDDLMPILLAAIGQPELAVVILALPTGAIEAALYGGIKELLTHHKKVTEYGGISSYRYYMSLRAEAKKKLKLQNKKDLIVPLAHPDSQNDSAIVSNSGLLKSIFNSIFDHQPRLTFHALKKIALANGFTRYDLKTLNRTVDGGNSAKAAFLFQWLDDHLTPDELAEVKKTYPMSFTKLDADPASDAILNWAADVADVHSCKDLLEVIGKAPMGTSVPLVMEVWTKVMMPELADSYHGLHISKFYRMSKSVKALEVAARLSYQETWNDQWETKLLTSVGKFCPQLPQ